LFELTIFLILCSFNFIFNFIEYYDNINKIIYIQK
jgi:hypothetical protein